MALDRGLQNQISKKARKSRQGAKTNDVSENKRQLFFFFLQTYFWKYLSFLKWLRAFLLPVVRCANCFVVSSGRGKDPQQTSNTWAFPKEPGRNLIIYLCLAGSANRVSGIYPWVLLKSIRKVQQASSSETSWDSLQTGLWRLKGPGLWRY